MIPRRIHYVWVGGDLPAEQQEFIETWRSTNPDFEIVRWDESNIDFSNPTVQEAYDRRQWSKVADFTRLKVIAEQGGIYMDTDFRVFHKLDALLQHTCFYAFQTEAHPTDWVSNGVFGAEPNHWFVRKALERTLAIRQPRFLPERPTAYGPKLVTALLREEGLSSYNAEGTMVKDVFICPVPMFFPFPMGEQFTPECVTPQTVAAHFWAESWAKDLPPLIRILRTGRRKIRRMLGGSGI